MILLFYPQDLNSQYIFSQSVSEYHHLVESADLGSCITWYSMSNAFVLNHWDVSLPLDVLQLSQISFEKTKQNKRPYFLTISFLKWREFETLQVLTEWLDKGSWESMDTTQVYFQTFHIKTEDKQLRSHFHIILPYFKTCSVTTVFKILTLFFTWVFSLPEYFVLS